MNLIFALPGFHRVDRGAEVALLAVAAELANTGDTIAVVGSGEPRENAPYRFIHVPSVARERFERFPSFPPLRSETAWEDATFAAGVLSRIDLEGYDASLTCSFPFTHWALRRKRSRGPAHVFVTQNGDWPAFSNGAEFRFFRCDGLVCTNPDYYARNHRRWPSALIPNGVDVGRFYPGKAERERFDLPLERPIVLMVSAFIASKRALDGIRAVAEIDGLYLVVAGDGPLRDEARALADELLPGRYKQLVLSADQMPQLYRSADVFLHLSRLESFGNVYLEAWASGLPIVAHDSERLRWILGEGQFLCDTSEPRRLVASLRSALKAGKAAIVPGIERFSWATIAEQYRQFIERVLARR